MKKLVIAASLILSFSTSFFAQETATLGLAERRALKEYQEKDFPQIKKDLMTSVGFEVPLDVKWEQIAKVGQADYYKDNQYWGSTIFKPLTEAIKTITADKEGKDALKAKLKKIIIIHDAKSAPISNYANGVKWEAGILTINFEPFTNADEGNMKQRVIAIQKLLESNL